MWWEFSAHNRCGNLLNYCSLIDKSRLEQGDTSSLSVHASTFSLAFESFANPCQWQPEWLNSWCHPCHAPGNSARLIPSPLVLYKDAVPSNITLQLPDLSLWSLWLPLRSFQRCAISHLQHCTLCRYTLKNTTKARWSYPHRLLATTMGLYIAAIMFLMPICLVPVQFYCAYFTSSL